MSHGETALNVSLGGEPFVAFAALFAEISNRARQSPLPDGLARHIEESELLRKY